jgi:hypothetical protein
MTLNPIGEPVPRGVIAYPARNTASDAKEAASQNGLYAWNELAEIGLSLAFLPAFAWASFVTTSATAWQSWTFPGLQTDTTPGSERSTADSRPFPT